MDTILEFNRLRQGKDESPMSFHVRLLGYENHMEPATEEERKNRFWSKLDRGLVRRVLASRSRGEAPKTRQQWLIDAEHQWRIKFEEDKASVRHHNSVPNRGQKRQNPQDDNNNNHNDNSNKQPRRSDKSNSNATRNKSERKSKGFDKSYRFSSTGKEHPLGTCWECGAEDHIKTKCPKLQNNRAKVQEAKKNDASKQSEKANESD